MGHPVHHLDCDLIMLKKINNVLMLVLIPLMAIGLYLGFTQDNSPLEVRYSLFLYPLCALLFGLSLFERSGWFSRLWNAFFFMISIIGIFHEISLL